ncbi:MAG: VWA domain-containing protein [Vicingaceae bacterium]
MGLDLDEWIYSKTVRFLKKKRKNAHESLPQKVDLETIRSRLTIVARAVSGDAIELFPAEKEGGYKNNNFFLPISFADFPTAEDNLSFYLYRVIFLCKQRALKLNWVDEKGDLKQSREQAAATAPKVLKQLKDDFPIADQLHDKFKALFQSKANPNEEMDRAWLYGKWMLNEAENSNELDPLKNFDEALKKKKEEDEVNTILKAKAVEEITQLTVDKKQQEDYVMTHNFEKVETADEAGGSWRDFDGKDDLADHQDALEELSMNQTVRVDDPVHSIYQAEFVENTTISESAERDEKGFHLKYDEWDYSKFAYRRDFCRVYPLSQLKSDPAYYQRTIAKNASTLMELRKMLSSLNNKMHMQRKQNQGDEFDLDALVDRYTDVYAGKTPNENIYLSNRKKEKDLSILLLLDISLSTDSYADNNRVIDVEKEVSILFGEILNEFDIDFSIDSFYSKTRNYSTYLSLKEFDEPWQKAKNKIGAIAPVGYTRIGSALRHAGARLDSRETKNKWVILLSDGKPNDYDKYEGKYGIHDVKQALRELNERNINSYALAIEAQAKYYLPQMFGKSQYQILTTPKDMLQSLVKVFEKIRHS